MKLLWPAILMLTCGAHAQTWARQNSGTKANLYAVHAKDTLNVIAVGDSVLLTTTNGGAAWIVTPRKGCATCRAFYLDSARGWEMRNTSPVGIARTTDGGTTWTTPAVPGNTADLCFSDSLTWYLAGRQDEITCGVCVTPQGMSGRTTTGGGSWNTATHSGTKPFKLISCRADVAYQLFADAPGNLYTASSGQGNGATSLGPTPIGTALQAIDFLNNRTVWITGTGGSLYSSANGTGSWAWTEEATGVLVTLRALDFVPTPAGATGWAVGDSGVILKRSGAPVAPEAVGVAPRRSLNPASPAAVNGRVDAQGRTLPETMLSPVPVFLKPETP